MTAELDRGLAELRINFATEIINGDITHIGTYGGCRRKNHKPDAPYSEHAWPGGNAADVHIRTNAVGDRVAAWMRSRPDLWAEVFWEIDLHWNHVHGTAWPRRNYDNQQIPPCAGGVDESEEDEMFSKQGQSGDTQEYWNRKLQWIGDNTGKKYALSGNTHTTALSNAVKDQVGGSGDIGPREMLNLELILAELQAEKHGGGSAAGGVSQAVFDQHQHPEGKTGPPIS